MADLQARKHLNIYYVIDADKKENTISSDEIKVRLERFHANIDQKEKVQAN